MNIDEDAVNRHARHEAARPKPNEHNPHRDFPVAMDFNASEGFNAASLAQHVPLVAGQEVDPLPQAKQFRIGQRVVATREISPRIPVGSQGIVVRALADINLIGVEWYQPGSKKPFAKTNGSPTRGIIPQEDAL